MMQSAPRSRIPGRLILPAVAGVLAAVVCGAPARAPSPAGPQTQAAPPPQAAPAPAGATAAPGAQTAPGAQATQEGQPGPGAKKPPARKPNPAVPLSIDALMEKVARYPGNAYLMNELGNQLLRAGRRLDAEEWFEKAVDQDGNFAAGWNNLGVVRMTLGRRSSAESAYREALDIQPAYALAWYNLGVVLDAENKYDEAIKAYERAFVLDPGLLDVKQNPQVVSNRHIPAIMSQTYIDRGGTVVFPLESAYSDSDR
jgi:tetratricopeptide (TPR) repeat protein